MWKYSKLQTRLIRISGPFLHHFLLISNRYCITNFEWATGCSSVLDTLWLIATSGISRVLEYSTSNSTEYSSRKKPDSHSPTHVSSIDMTCPTPSESCAVYRNASVWWCLVYCVKTHTAETRLSVADFFTSEFVLQSFRAVPLLTLTEC